MGRLADVKSSLSRSDGVGDRSRSELWRGCERERALRARPLRQRFALPPPHACGTGRIERQQSMAFRHKLVAPNAAGAPAFNDYYCK